MGGASLFSDLPNAEATIPKEHNINNVIACRLRLDVIPVYAIFA